MSSEKPRLLNGNRIAAGIRAMLSNPAKRSLPSGHQDAKRASPFVPGAGKQAIEDSSPADKELLVEFHGELKQELDAVETKRATLEDQLKVLKNILARSKEEEKSLIGYFVENPGSAEEMTGFQKALDKIEIDQVALKAEIKNTFGKSTRKKARQAI